MNQTKMRKLEEIVQRRLQFANSISELHRQDNFGELLPHLWLSDVLRAIHSRIEAAPEDEKETVRIELLRSLSAAIEDVLVLEDQEFSDLISVGLFESIGALGEDRARLVRVLGPKGLSSYRMSDNFE